MLDCEEEACPLQNWMTQRCWMGGLRTSTDQLIACALELECDRTNLHVLANSLQLQQSSGRHMHCNKLSRR